MAAQLIDKIGGSTWVNGYEQFSLTHIYYVLAPRASSITTVLHWPGIPRAGSSALLGGQLVWVSNPTCKLEDSKNSKWIVTVPYTNQTSQFERDDQGNPVDDPTKAVKQVSIHWEDREEPVNFAKFRKWTLNAPEKEGGVDVSGASPPAWIKDGPVTNSAGVPIMVMRKKRIKHISVSRVVRDWQSNWEDYQNAVNTDAVSIIEKDKDGQRAKHTFDAFTLRMSISTPNEWKDGKLFFRPTFSMEFNEKTWIHAELDRGQKRRGFVGQVKPEDSDGNITYTADDLEAFKIFGTTTDGRSAGFISIMTDAGKVAIGDPVLFNGFSAESNIDSAVNGPVYGNWDVEINLKAFGPLNL